MTRTQVSSSPLLLHVSHLHKPVAQSSRSLAIPRHHASLPSKPRVFSTPVCVLPAAALLFTELLLVGWAESKRLADYNNPGSQGDGSFFGITDGLKGQDNGYPGQFAAPFCQ